LLVSCSVALFDGRMCPRTRFYVIVGLRGSVLYHRFHAASRTVPFLEKHRENGCRIAQ
jgi:hypothetical protein